MSLRIVPLSVFIVGMLTTPVRTSTLDSSLIYLHYSLAKSTFLTGEPVFVSAQLVNHSNDTVHYELDELWRLSITGQDGLLLPRRSPIGTPHYLVQRDKNGNRIDPRPMLLPGQSSRVFIHNVADDYGDGEGVYDFYLPRGQFRIASSQFASDTVFVSVVDPLDAHSLEAMRVLTEAIDRRTSSMPDAAAKFRFYSEFYERYSDTPLAERALRNLSGWFPPETPGRDVSKQQQFTRALVLRFPNSGFILSAICRLKPEYVPPSERDSIVRILQERIDDLFSESQINQVKQTLLELQK